MAPSKSRRKMRRKKKKLDFSGAPTDKISSVSEFRTPTDQIAPASTQVDGSQPSQQQDVAQPLSQPCEKSSTHVDRRKGKKAPAAFLRTSWKPGQSGNPAGRNIRNALELSREIIDMMREPVRDGSHKTRLHAILAKQFELAMRGDHKAVEFLSNRAFGKEVALLAVKGEGVLPAGVGMQTILQIMRDSGDEQAIAIAEGAARVNVVDVENREIAPPVEPDTAMTTTYESGEIEPAAHNRQSYVSDCNDNIGNATERTLCDVASPRDDAPPAQDAKPETHQGEGYLTDGVAPLPLSPSE